MRLNETIGRTEADNLINSTYPPALTFGIMLRKGQGILRRGTLLARSSADGSMVIAGSTPESGEELKANCVLTDDVSVPDGSGQAAIAYRTGHFNEDALMVKEGYSITGDDKEALRQMGILLSDAISI